MRRSRPRRVFERCFGPRNTAFAWFVLLVAAMHPPYETSLNLCWLRASTGIPCPGCGLTRSLASAVRGLVETSWSYHPFGLPLLGLVLMLAGGIGCPAPCACGATEMEALQIDMDPNGPRTSRGLLPAPPVR